MPNMISTESAGKSAVFKRMIEMEVHPWTIMAYPFGPVVNVGCIGVAGVVGKMRRGGRLRTGGLLRTLHMYRFLRTLLPWLRSAGGDILPSTTHLSTATVLFTPLGSQGSQGDQG
jgi:hypothetical protein